MSNYSRSFDESAGGGGERGGYRHGGFRDVPRGDGRGGGGRFQSARGGVQSGPDGGTRKPVQRKAIDGNVLLMKQQEDRFQWRDWRDRPILEPSGDSIRSLPAVVDDVSHNPALGICTKYISLCVSKARCPITTMSWTPDGRRIVTGSHTGEFTQWNGSQFNFESIVLAAHDDPIRAMTWTHNDLLMLTADEGGVVKYWQSTLNNIKAFKAHKEPVRDLSCAPNDIHFVTCSDDQTASIWDLETSKEVVCLKGHGYDVKACKWHPTKGIIITGSKDQLIKIWDPREGTGGMNHGRNEHCLADIHAHKNTVNRLAWSPLNPNWFLSGSRDNLVKVFDIRTMKDFQTNRAHKKEISSLAWHPTIERLFASGSADGLIHQWFVGENDSQAEITGAHDLAVYGLQWHPAGHLLASSSQDATTRFWARNRPGDEMTDKYNVSSLPAAQKALAVSTLVEAAKMNPSKYSRLPASLAEFAQQGQQEMAEATAKSAYQQEVAGASSDFIPGMGSVPGMGMKRELSTQSTTSSSAPYDTKPSYFDSKPSATSSYSSSAHQPSSRSGGGGDSYSRDRASRPRSRSRSRSRERDHHHSSSSRGGGGGGERPSRFGPPSTNVNAPSGGGGGGYNAFFPAPQASSTSVPPQRYGAAQPVPVPLSFAPQPQSYQQPMSGGFPPPQGYAPPPQQMNAGYGNFPPPPQMQPNQPQPGYGAFPPPPPQQQMYPPPNQPQYQQRY